MSKVKPDLDNHFCPGAQQPQGSKLISVVFAAALSALVLGTWVLASAIGGL